MKILLINKFFYRKGGSETVLFAERELLRSHGHEVIDFSMRDERNEPSPFARYFIDPIDFSRSEGLARDAAKAAHLLYSTNAREKLAQLLDITKPDVAHVHNVHYQLTPAIFSLLAERGIPIVWTLHDYKLICPNAELFTQGSVCQRCKKFKYYEAVFNRCVKDSTLASMLGATEATLHALVLRSYRHVARFISPSVFLQRTLGEWGVGQGRVTQLYNPVTIPRVATPSGEPYVLYAGRLTEVKGITDLLESCTHTRHIPMIIAGDGPMAEDVRRYIDSHNMSHVRYVGQVPQDRLRSLIAGARCVVVPSIWYENNPLAVLEAFAQGVPVIGSNRGGIPELIGDNERGILVPAQDSHALVRAIAALWNDPERARTLGMRGQEFVKKAMDPEKHYEELMKIYKEVISER